MITGKYINLIIIGLLLIAIIFTSFLMMTPETIEAAAQNAQPQYESKLFNKDSIISIDIKVNESEWNNMLENATKEEYIPCDVTINGTTFSSVGIRPKGNSSLSTVAGSDSDRFSFKFEFDQYIDGQTCFGLDKLVINNIQADATYMKEYLSYEIMDYMGVTAPLHAYTDVTVNGKKWGFYIAVEAMEESFAERSYGSDYGMLYKPESMGARGNGNMNDFINNKNTSTANTQITGNAQKGGFQGGFGGGFGGMGGNSGGTDLIYTDDNISSYSNIFDNQVFEGTKADYNKVIEAIKNLNNGKDIEKYINVDEVLKYIAVNTFVVNLDSYFSNMKHNYYLYEEDGQLSMLPWDYNLAFAGFQSGSADEAVNFPIDTPVSGVELSERPIIAKLLEVDEYKEKYHEYLKEIVDGYINNGTFESTVNKLDSLISRHVKDDASAFYTFDKYTAAVPTLKEFANLRAESIKGQLEGTIPSTTEGQSTAQDKLIDASSINLTTMGSQGGGNGGRAMGQQGGMQRPDNITGDLPDREVTMKAMQIIQAANGEDLTDEQLNQLKDLGLTDEQIELMKKMAGQFGNRGDMNQGGQFGDNQPPDGMQQPGKMNIGAPEVQGSGSAGVYDNTTLLMIAVSVICLVMGLIFVFRFKRRRYAKSIIL